MSTLDKIVTGQLISTLADGTSPMQITSNTLVDNLHVSRVTLSDDGYNTGDTVISGRFLSPVSGFLYCNGQAIDISYTALTALCGNTTPNIANAGNCLSYYIKT